MPKSDKSTPGKSSGSGFNAGIAGLDPTALAELIRRLRDIDRGYREVAEKMGHLYMLADSHNVGTLTRQLDRAMQFASHSERTLAAILDELQCRVERPARNG